MESLCFSANKCPLTSAAMSRALLGDCMKWLQASGRSWGSSDHLLPYRRTCTHLPSCKKMWSHHFYHRYHAVPRKIYRHWPNNVQLISCQLSFELRICCSCWNTSGPLQLVWLSSTVSLGGYLRLQSKNWIKLIDQWSRRPPRIEPSPPFRQVYTQFGP